MPVPFDAAEHNRNLSTHTWEELAPYLEQHVAWSLDGKQILAHAQDLTALLQEIARLGLKEYVLGFIPSPDRSDLGGGWL
jgi:hypothetical protein